MPGFCISYAKLLYLKIHIAPTTKIAKTRARRLKYLSINSLILTPQILMMIATRKNLAPREISEHTRKGINGNLQNPAVKVTALYGNGVNPAINTAHVS